MADKTIQLEVSPKEFALITALRKRFTFGEVVITMRDGQPQHIKRAWENDSLSAEDLK